LYSIDYSNALHSALTPSCLLRLHIPHAHLLAQTPAGFEDIDDKNEKYRAVELGGAGEELEGGAVGGAGDVLRGWREGWVAGPEFGEAGVGCVVDIALGDFLAVGHGEQVKGLVRRAGDVADAGFGCVGVGDGLGAVLGISWLQEPF